MSFGMRIWGAAGALEFDTSTSTYRIVLSVLVSFAGEPRNTKTFQALGCTPSNAICFLLPINNDASEGVGNRQLECEMGAEVVYVRNFLAGAPNESLSRATMRLIVARWS